MIARLHSAWLALRASYWFYPALFAVFGLVLALATIHLDRHGAADWLEGHKMIVPVRPDGASNMLGVLASAMIGTAATVFSITIAAVAYASGNYGPRLLTNFMEDRGNQFSLATFIGTFVYAITVLRAVRTAEETPGGPAGAFAPQLSLLVAFALMIVAVGVLVYFLHHIPASIRINVVLESIGKRLLTAIEKRYPQKGERDPAVRPLPHGKAVCATKTGYVRILELGSLLDIAREHDLLIGLNVRTGDFVYPGVEIARTDARHLPDEVGEQIRACLAVGATRTTEQDLEFSIDELVEIALRALSPGINDPFTAITALHWLGAATVACGTRNLAAEDWNGGDPACPLSRCHSDFAHFLERGLVSTRGAVATSRLASLVALETLERAARLVTGPHRRALLLAEAEALVEQAQHHLVGPDLADVRQRLEVVRASA
ncbi:DUF2254 domain-containing protein [Novosphingobium sp. YJ-S2-02]|uniref:DUF2254 domain-containing protein n=1 Tax=Novosphingobium aureum TaxID=2792964 RepID=A0A931HF05_9SPHN|nr:DUF2254 domain-containing protein [Novosphingobium aureum]MBH0114164.1 DUF2254 domain-containing protein [Novosphingobium aureum]